LLGQLRQALGPSTAVMPLETVPPDRSEEGSGKKMKRRAGFKKASEEEHVVAGPQALDSPLDANGHKPASDSKVTGLAGVDKDGQLDSLLEGEEEEEDAAGGSCEKGGDVRYSATADSKNSKDEATILDPSPGGFKSAETRAPPLQHAAPAMPLYTAIAAQLSSHKQQISAAFDRPVFLGEEALIGDGVYPLGHV